MVLKTNFSFYDDLFRKSPLIEKQCMSDEEIIRLLKAGKFHPATKKLYSYFPVVKKFVLKNSGTKQEAEDVFQDALIIFFNKAKRVEFELTSTINTYLFSVSRLIWMEELRKKNKQLTTHGFIKEEFYDNDQLQQEVETDAKLKKVQGAVDKLGEKCRQLLEMFYHQKKSMKDIAKSLGFATEKVAKNQKYRCIEKAKEFLRTN